MALDILDPTKNLGSGIYGQPKRTTKKELGKDDFLLLLTKQLQYQDPTKPVENLDFINQMASFSSLEQMTNMNKSLESFMKNTYDANKFNAMSLLGATVTALPTDATEPIKGVASGVRFSGSDIMIKIGDQEVTMDQIQSATVE